MQKTYHCKLCKKDNIPVVPVFPQRIDLMNHYRSIHPEHISNQRKPKSNVQSTILQGVELIKKALCDVDVERNVLQQKLLNLDNLSAKYKKLI